MPGAGKPATQRFGCPAQVDHQGQRNCTVSCLAVIMLHRDQVCIVSCLTKLSDELPLPPHSIWTACCLLERRSHQFSDLVHRKTGVRPEGAASNLHLSPNTPMQALSRAMLLPGEAPTALLCPTLLHNPQGQTEASSLKTFWDAAASHQAPTCRLPHVCSLYTLQ